MKNISIMVAALLLMLAVWTFSDVADVTEQDFAAFLHDYEAKVIPLSREEAISYFDAMVSGSDTDYERSAQATIALERRLSPD
jgi:hypothetical protein